MAVRPAFAYRESPPYFTERSLEFIYNKGTSAKQKQKNICAIHDVHLSEYGSYPLEVSSKSMQGELGVKLSAFNLKMHVPELGRSIPVENIYQASKVFESGGPYTDLYDISAKQAKKDTRLTTSGKLIGYRYHGRDYPLNPSYAFYNWLYISALMENADLAGELLKYDSFTDIEYVPSKSVNCQARAAAIYVGLSRCGLLGDKLSFQEYVDLTSSVEG